VQIRLPTGGAVDLPYPGVSFHFDHAHFGFAQYGAMTTTSLISTSLNATQCDAMQRNAAQCPRFDEEQYKKHIKGGLCVLYVLKKSWNVGSSGDWLF
jgi:hypothetical protein